MTDYATYPVTDADFVNAIVAACQGTTQWTWRTDVALPFYQHRPVAWWTTIDGGVTWNYVSEATQTLAMHLLTLCPTYQSVNTFNSPADMRNNQVPTPHRAERILRMIIDSGQLQAPDSFVPPPIATAPRLPWTWPPFASPVQVVAGQ